MVVASCYGLSCRKHSLLHRPGASDPVKAVTPEYSLMFNSEPVFTGLPCATYRTAVPAPQAIYGLQGSQQQTSTLVKIVSVRQIRELKPTEGAIHGKTKSSDQSSS